MNGAADEIGANLDAEELTNNFSLASATPFTLCLNERAAGKAADEKRNQASESIVCAPLSYWPRPAPPLSVVCLYFLGRPAAAAAFNQAARVQLPATRTS